MFCFPDVKTTQQLHARVCVCVRVKVGDGKTAISEAVDCFTSECGSEKLVVSESRFFPGYANMELNVMQMLSG